MRSSSGLCDPVAFKFHFIGRIKGQPLEGWSKQRARFGKVKIRRREEGFAGEYGPVSRDRLEISTLGPGEFWIVGAATTIMSPS